MRNCAGDGAPAGFQHRSNMKKYWIVLQTNIKPIYAHSLEEFNSYVEKYKAPNEIILTKGKNIAQINLRNLPCCRTWQRGNRMEFHYIDGRSQIRVIYALHYDQDSDKDEQLSYQALNYFKGCMNLIPTDDEEEDIEVFKCPENKESTYYNYVNPRYIGWTQDNCYSLDRNNSFPASMMEVYPQTRPFVEKYYQERLQMKGQPGYEDFKLYGSIFVGWLKSPKYYRSHAWHRIIDNSNKKVHQLRQYIESQGHPVLLVNTDAVKFIGAVDYQESTQLGQFKYEWKNTKMYIKGVKSYAYLDQDKWKFKQAGKCLLDSLIPDRDQWTLEQFKNGPTEQVAKVIIEQGYLKEVFE